MGNDYLGLIENYKEEMIIMLQELLSIKSVADVPKISAPFGKGVSEAFHFMLDKGKTEGFDIENADEFGGHIEFGGYILDENGEVEGTSLEVMGILAHLDVVPEGNDWDYEPYGGQIADGKIYGRGAIDDKGPTVAAFYAMKALKDAGFIPEKKVRLILGLDEETGWKGMEYYLKRFKAPNFGFTPDAEFPAIHGEMGILIFELAKKIGKTPAGLKGIELRSLTGGNAPNMVADSARAVFRGENYDEIKEKIAEFRKTTGYQINAKGIGKSLEVKTQGVSAHGARPSSGLNAISVMMKFLGEINLINEDVNDFIDFYNQNIGFDLCGDAIGCGVSDEPSGKLIFNVGIVNLDAESASLTINIRYPVTMKDQQIHEQIIPALSKYNLGIIKIKNQEPIYVPENSELVSSLMEVYKKHTGDETSRPLVIGGGTYARASKNIVAFGATFPGQPELAHQKNEYIEIENLIKCTKIFADAIISLAGGKFRNKE